jgi:hypothetical protein
MEVTWQSFLQMDHLYYQFYDFLGVGSPNHPSCLRGLAVSCTDPHEQKDFLLLNEKQQPHQPEGNLSGQLI